MPRAGPSARILDAIALVGAAPGEALLEIGCGTGQAIAAVLPRLADGRMVAIDRSEKAVASARALNAAAIAAHRLEIRRAAIEDGAVPPCGFDRVFAIRVNSFWIAPAKALPAVRQSMRAGGTLCIVFDGPDARIDGPVRAALAEHGFVDIRTRANDRALAWVARAG